MEIIGKISRTVCLSSIKRPGRSTLDIRRSMLAKEGKGSQQGSNEEKAEVVKARGN